MEKEWKKSLSWNALAFTVTALTCFIITGKVEIAGTISIIERVIKLIIYPFHEKLWK